MISYNGLTNEKGGSQVAAGERQDLRNAMLVCKFVRKDIYNLLVILVVVLLVLLVGCLKAVGRKGLAS